jgi:NDP-sugar pyrophosphorylase family protein
MKAVILAGGMGIRLRPLTFAIPKPLIPLGEKPILEILISRLKKFGIKEYIFLVGYKADIIEVYFGDGSRFGVDIKYMREDKPLGTAGPLSLLRKEGYVAKDDTFLLLNGDLIFKMDIDNFLDFHKTNEFDLSVCTIKHKMQVPYGVIKMEGDQITGIEEKPVFEFDISAGIYMVNAQPLDLIPYNEFFTMPEYINMLFSRGKKVGGYKLDGHWLAIDRLEDISEVVSNKDKWLFDSE